jgi:single-stranded-DNA-specific exonuclease
MFHALQEAGDLLDQFGGHAMAAGLALDIKNLPRLKELLEARARVYLKPEDLVSKLVLDAKITMQDVNKQLVHDMQLFEPFGAQNSEPKFVMQGVSLVQKPQMLKDVHLKCLVFADGIIKPLIFFNRPDLFEPLLLQEEKPFDIAVQITQNSWQGKTNIELLGLDAAGVKKE